MSSLELYIYAILAIIIGFFVIKKVASCIIRILVLLILLAIAAYLYLTLSH